MADSKTDLKMLCSENVNSMVFPGHKITLKPQLRVRLGLGLLEDKDAVIASKAGFLRQSGSNRIWVDNSQKRYIPLAEDMVVGIVIEKHVDNYRVDIGAQQPARLPSLAFEGASKRNRPNIQVGGLVYCRVVISNKDMETELSCTSPHFKKDWVTGESLFGELKGGFAFKSSLRLARSLLDEDCFVLKCLAKHVPFELAIGANGYIWLNSAEPSHTIAIYNAILNSENQDNNRVATMVDKIFSLFV